MILSFHGGDNKTGTTQLSQTTAFMWGKLNKDKKVLMVSLNKKKSSEFISESCLSIETYRNIDEDSIFEKYRIFDNCYFMAGPLLEWQERRYYPKDSLEILERAKNHFHLIVCDTGSDISSGLAIGALTMSDYNILVLTQEEETLLRWESLRDIYKKLNVDFTVTIINKYKFDHPALKDYIGNRLSLKGEIITVPYLKAGYKAALQKQTFLDSSYKSCHKYFLKLIEKVNEINER